MATIGQVLTTPEAGWQRIDFTFPMANVEFETGWQILTNASLYGGTAAYLNNGTIEDGKSNKKAKFKFKGTKIRIITTFFIAGNTIYISIDGNINTMNTYKETASHQTLGFEQLGLQDTVHTVEVWTDAIPTGIYLDAIDIDSTGKLVNPKEKTSLSEMQIGDMISCEYVATSGNVGTFSNLGSATKALIPPISSATPNGSFYFIHAGYDHKGRMKLIADRNIQHSISWDKLNSEGIVPGKDINLNLENDYKTSIRLLTGGISATDKNNEWDKIIVESTLNGTITAGDNNVWNWNVTGCQTSTSTVSSASNTARATRGIQGDISLWAGVLTNNSNASMSFRPMLIVEYINSSKNRFLILDAGKYKTIIDGVLTTVCNETDPEEIKLEAFNQGLLTPGEFINYFENLENSSIKLLRFLASQ